MLLYVIVLLMALGGMQAWERKRGIPAGERRSFPLFCFPSLCPARIVSPKFFQAKYTSDILADSEQG